MEKPLTNQSDYSAPIHRLLDELLMKQMFNRACKLDNGNLSLWAASAVCQRWRSFALSGLDLWS
ncbi:hypothetical protein BDV98DRAFT_560135 [Pterulicium gracile]|uniref:F-box domain-containing protein n=1 Tax=Pterulicium gracile TaxID=1884261 RepID=A0A5C3QVQ5_9AGAR|nr:hypothetical protein BDV98DRAFT_560135 [Pterula gracilis]